MHAVQGLGTLADGAVGLTAATMVVMNWTHLRARLIQAQQAEAEATSTGP
jgi:hypothetical protein